MAFHRTTVASLNPDRDDWQVIVVAARTWRHHAYMRPSDIISFDVVFMDEQGSRIHATVKKHLMDKFEPLIQESVVYTISGFGVAENRSGFKMANHPYKINFYRTTFVAPFSGPFMATKLGLHLTPFSSLLSGEIGESHAVDVIGHIVSTSGVSASNDDGRVKRMSFDLSDIGGVTLHCTLWDSLAEHLADFVSTMLPGIRVIVVIQLGRLRPWQGELIFNNCFFGTKILINTDADEILAFRKQLEGSTGVAHAPSLAANEHSSPTKHFLSGVGRVTIDNLRQLKKVGKYVIVGTISCVQKDEPWFYLACRRCKKGVEPSESIRGKETWMCPKCDRHGVEVVNRFKVNVRVQDGSGSVSLVLFDQDVSDLLQTSAPQLLASLPEDVERDCYPEDFSKLVGRRFAFKVGVDWKNANAQSQVYTVVKLTEDAELIQQALNLELGVPFGDTSIVPVPTTPCPRGKRPREVFDESDTVESSGSKQTEH